MHIIRKLYPFSSKRERYSFGLGSSVRRCFCTVHAMAYATWRGEPSHQKRTATISHFWARVWIAPSRGIIEIILHPLCVTVKYYHLPRVKIGWFLTNNSLMPNALCINELSSRKPAIFRAACVTVAECPIIARRTKNKNFRKNKNLA